MSGETIRLSISSTLAADFLHLKCIQAKQMPALHFIFDFCGEAGVSG
jgi:hypothetical protein